MNTVLVPAFDTAMTEISRDLIAAVAEHPGDSPARRLERQQAVADTMMSLEPQTPIETILAGHCLVFDHLILESAHHLLNCEEEKIRLRIRPQICASARMFLAELEKFEQRNTRSMVRLAAEQRIETRLVQPAQRAAAQASTQPAEPARAAPPDQSGKATQPPAAANQPPPERQEISSPEVPAAKSSDPSPDPDREHAEAQINPDSPLAAERERAMIPARSGQSAATSGEQLLALIHEAGLARTNQRNSDALAGGGNGADDATEAGSSARETRVDELV
jgi:hypothetical protein